MPASALLVRSPDAFFVPRPTATPMATAPATPIPIVHHVERRVRSLIHSILATCQNR
jgi:hypothetical protein